MYASEEFGFVVIIYMSVIDIECANNTELIKQNELYEPMLYYGSKPRIVVEYISDIHLLHILRMPVDKVYITVYTTSRAGGVHYDDSKSI